MVDFVRAADPSMVLFSGTTLASQFDEAYLVTKVFGAVIAAFASGALLLAVVGIYGVVAFGIVQRTREIGIRVALGGTPRDVLRMLVGESLRFAGTGIGLGLVLSIGLGRFVRVFLAGVSPLDPLTYAVVIPLFALTALVACYIPARRATRIDPLSALRVE
jgi:ABC-type antimicrobial peptide transport system permease subunit